MENVFTEQFYMDKLKKKQMGQLHYCTSIISKEKQNLGF